MISQVKKTFNAFRERGGFHIFLSTILLKIIQFVLGVLIIRLLTKEDYGNLSYAYTITQLIIPFSGAGLYLSLLHFGSIQNELKDKFKLFNFTLQRGFIYSLLVILIMIGLSGLVSVRLPGAAPYLRLFSIYIISYYLFHSAMSLLRVRKQNKHYAWSLLLNSSLVFILSIMGVFLSKGTGYILGFSLAPALTGVIVLFLLKYKYKVPVKIFQRINNLPVKVSEYTKYGVFAGLGNIASQMAWQLDTIMIGALLAQSTMVATYKVSALIPFSLIFIPSVFMQTDFVYIAEKYNNKKYLISYYKKYFLIFFAIATSILSIWYIFGGWIVGLFGPEYIDARPLINILMINVAGTFLFRVPLGNILAAVGKAKWNTYSAVAMLVINFILNYILIPKYDIYGAAYATVISISLSCVISIFMFFTYLKQISPKDLNA
ncbi:MAG: polysaccharide biosynthesis C-terminal domain-containing protein [Candidatus Marinimicrobia bacterium]|nr:polysaccharide biosynthesis C-terminal domain-containing protein [Candidatus Neomarinimicrobiota bacterium]